MIIDCILDRREDEAFLEACGGEYPECLMLDGSVFDPHYNAHTFYTKVLMYCEDYPDDYATAITREMDFGTEESVRAELARYIKEQKYNPEIIDYIYSVKWLPEENNG